MNAQTVYTFIPSGLRPHLSTTSDDNMRRGILIFDDGRSGAMFLGLSVLAMILEIADFALYVYMDIPTAYWLLAAFGTAMFGAVTFEVYRSFRKVSSLRMSGNSMTCRYTCIDGIAHAFEEVGDEGRD